VYIISKTVVISRKEMLYNLFTIGVVLLLDDARHLAITGHIGINNLF
jgi:hypothetical protein